jgi:hypothetical protein
MINILEYLDNSDCALTGLSIVQVTNDLNKLIFEKLESEKAGLKNYSFQDLGIY